MYNSDRQAIQITPRDHVVALLQAEQDSAKQARQWLEGLQGRVTLVNLLPLTPSQLVPQPSEA
ncbi:MAG: hypothetical protein ACKO6F_03070 [Cyanobium sp.]